MLKRAATRTARGTRSGSISTRFASMSVTWALSPVTFPPGRARLAERCATDGSASSRDDDGNRRRRLLGRERATGLPLVTIAVDLQPNQLSRPGLDIARRGRRTIGTR